MGRAGCLVTKETDWRPFLSVQGEGSLAAVVLVGQGWLLSCVGSRLGTTSLLNHVATSPVLPFAVCDMGGGILDVFSS